MKVVILQSNYLPWKGYFDLAHDADVFVFHDDLQYTKNDWRNRNKIKTAHGPEWLTIPVGTDEHRLINQVALPSDTEWAERHWHRIESHYRSAPYFAQYAPFFRDVYKNRTGRLLSHLNQFLITTIARDFLGITTTFVDSAQFRLTSRKQERVLELLKVVGATTYISGPAARAYLDPECLRAAGIDLVWKDYSGYPEYTQFHPPFTHAVSIIDLLFHTGPAARNYIWAARCPGTPARSETNVVPAESSSVS